MSGVTLYMESCSMEELQSRDSASIALAHHRADDPTPLEGYLAHKKPTPLLGLP